MRVVFMGSADFAVPALESVVQAGFEVLAVVTQPDRPRGRGKKLAQTPVKEKANSLGLALCQPENSRSPEFITWLQALQPDLVLVVAYGQILSSTVLEIPRLGCVNLHASLLPKYRGAAPIHWAIMQGEEETGVTTILMDAGLDTGDIILQETCPIPANATTGEIYPILAQRGAALLVRTVELLFTGQVCPQKQDANQATYAPTLQRADERIDWQKKAREIRNQIRGLNPWPGAYTEFAGKNLKICQSEIWSGERPVPLADPQKGSRADFYPGEIILVIKKQGFLVQTGDQPLLIKEVQPTGKQKISAYDFSLGYRIQSGTRLN